MYYNSEKPIHGDVKNVCKFNLPNCTLLTVNFMSAFNIRTRDRIMAVKIYVLHVANRSGFCSFAIQYL